MGDIGIRPSRTPHNNNDDDAAVPGYLIINELIIDTRVQFGLCVRGLQRSTVNVQNFSTPERQSGVHSTDQPEKPLYVKDFLLGVEPRRLNVRY